jgi:hypothetical protein
MSRFGCLLCFSLLLASVAFPQEEDFRLYTDHPRLLLTRQRLRLLRRERDRRSMRWQQLETLIAGKAPMPEPGFSAALYSQVSLQPDACLQAVAWALSPAADLRQQALVFDWCQTVLSSSNSQALAARLQRGLAPAPPPRDIPTVRSRVFAAIALADLFPGLSQRELRFAVTNWWRAGLVPALRQGHAAIPRDQSCAFFELLHVLRDNLNIDLRESFPAFFKDLPVYHVLSYSPAPYSAPENDYHIPISGVMGKPDLQRAALSRVAELSMVAYDTNAVTNQFLQGWLMQDRYMLRGAFGAPYEFLWANPYQPGLSYYHLPLVFHDTVFGTLLVRSSWEDDASWFGYFDGHVAVYGGPDPIQFGGVLVVPARQPLRFTLDSRDATQAFIIGLNPRATYEVEMEHQKTCELTTDAGGILALAIPSHSTTLLHLHPKRGQ